MSLTGSRRWPAITLTTMVVAAAASVVVMMFRYPGMLDDPNAGLWSASLATVFVGYAVLTLAAFVQSPSRPQVWGIWFGVAAGVLWLAELWTQAPARLSPGLEHKVPAICAITAALVTVAAGVVGGVVNRSGTAALNTGFWAGLVSGAVMMTGMVAIQVTHVDLLAARPDYQQELAASGIPNMGTYVAADAVAAGTTHMVINLALGLIGGAIGWIIVVASKQFNPA